jgi:tetratricopeptide (TPR) repeat protein
MISARRDIIAVRTMPRRATYWPVAAAAAVLLAVCAAYANSLQNGFHFDDFHTIVDNPSIRSLRNLPSFFTDATTFSVLPANRTYRPFVSASLAMDYAMGHGYTPFWFHIGTLLVFLLQLVTMLWLFRRILGSTLSGRGGSHASASAMPTAAALFAVAWYGLHPAIAETVNYIIQRGDIYSTLGVVGALAMYAGLPRLRRTGLYLAPFVFGILSKPPAIVLPALLFAYVAYFEGDVDYPGVGVDLDRSRWKKAAIAALPSLVVGGAAMVLQARMTPKSFTPATSSHWHYCMTQPFVLIRYFGSFFLPVHLNVDTHLEPFRRFTPEAAAGFVFILLLLMAIFWTGRRVELRPVSFGLLWFLVASIPTSVYTLSEVENDHRMYMPFVGLVLAVTWALALLVEQVERTLPHARRYAAVFGVVVLCVYGWGVHVRNRVWSTEESLWLDDIQKSPHNGRGLMIYGLTQMAKGNYPGALDDFTRALRYTPNYPTLQINLGVVYGAMGKQALAEKHFLRAIELAPSDDQTHFYYGRWLVETNRLSDALEELQEAVRLNPARLPQRDLLAKVLVATGDTRGAVTLANATLTIAPGDAAAREIVAHADEPLSADNWINVSLLRYQQKDFAGAVAAALQALKLNAGSSLAYNNLGAGYAGLGEWDAAVGAEKQALRLNPHLQIAQNNLAVYTVQQRAVEASAAAIHRSGQTPEALLNASLVLYQAHRYEESMAAARAALHLRPEYAEAWNNIAADDVELGRWDEAIAAATQALRLQPDFPLARNNLAWAVSAKAKHSHP